jgi:hypothetical protein
MPVRRLLGKSEFTLVMTILPESEPGAVGEVAIEFGSGERFPFYLEPRFFHVLRILIEAALRDLDLEFEARGVRSKAVIAQHYAAQKNVVATVRDDVIKQYVRAIRDAFKPVIQQIIREVGIFPPPMVPSIITTIRQRGYSIGEINVVFIDHSATNRSLRL